jgi:hypothetical protein
LSYRKNKNVSGHFLDHVLDQAIGITCLGLLNPFNQKKKLLLFLAWCKHAKKHREVFETPNPCG